MVNFNMLRYFYVLLFISFSQLVRSQIILIQIPNDRSELTKALGFINSNSPIIIGLNIFISDCFEDKVDNDLAIQLVKTKNLLMPTELRPGFNNGFHDVIGCPYLYPLGVETGFTDLISDSKDEYSIKEFQIKNVNEYDVAYHYAVMLALAINKENTLNYINSSENIIPLDLGKKRQIETYDIADFYEKKVDESILEGKAVIIGERFEDKYMLSNSTADEITTREIGLSEILANIVCQILED